MRQTCNGLLVLLGVLPSLLVDCRNAERSTAPQTQEVSLQTVDGVSIAATIYPVNAAAPPGLILVHMLGSNRASWQSFASHAQADGYLCIAIDLRGHGDSLNAGGTKLSYKNFTTQEWLGALADIDAARKELLKQGANPKDMAVIGASIGANLALHYANERTEIPAVVMISPGIDYKGVGAAEEIVTFGNRPCLLVTSEGDAYSASSCTTFKKAASGLCELREYPGSFHGTNVLDSSQAALKEVLLWLAPILKPSQQGSPAQG